MMPTANHVAAAIVAACRETGADPEQVAMGVNVSRGQIGTSPLAHARAYAALALRAVFEDCPARSISRMVGARLPGGYLASLDSQRQNGKLKWWDDAAFMRVIKAIERSMRPVSSGPLKAYPIIRVARMLGASVTAELLGDPAPGRSALGARNGE